MVIQHRIHHPTIQSRDTHTCTHFLRLSERGGHRYLESRYITDRVRESDRTIGTGGFHRLVWVSSKLKAACDYQEKSGLDPGINGGMSPFYQTLHDELCKDGPDHCPAMFFAKGESHMSEVFSIDTGDKTVSGAVLAWMKKVK